MFTENRVDSGVLVTDFADLAQIGRQSLSKMLSSFQFDKRVEIEKLIDAFMTMLDCTMAERKYNDIPTEFVTCWHEMVAILDGKETVWGAVLLSALLARVPDRLMLRHYPEPITNEFFYQLRRIALELSASQIHHMTLNNDLFLKDFGVCRLDVFPCWALLVEKKSGISRRLALNNGICQLLHIVKLVSCNGLRFQPYLEIHAHTPMLKNFNPEGWDRCYHLVAKLLRLFPEYHGLVGGSWFFDPEIEHVSPHLYYLRQRAKERGAYFLKIGSSQDDVLNATAKSKHRLKLYEEGRYLPTSYLMIWPRSKLLAWSDNNAH